MKTEKILLAGATGYLGQYILDELKEMEVYEGAKIVGKIVFE